MLNQVLSLTILSALAAHGQIAPPLNAPAPKSAAPEITVTAVVASATGQFVTGLQPGDFTLLDNKVPLPITSFRELDAEKDPVDVILVVDTVNTDYQYLVTARDDLDKFLHTDGGHLGHYTSLVVFKNVGTQMQQNFTSSGTALSARLDKNTTDLRTLRPGAVSGNVERLQLSLALLSEIAKAQADRPGHKLVIWISPGWPLIADPETVLSAAQQDQIFSTIVTLSKALREANVTLYNVDPLGTVDAGVKSFFYKDYLGGISKPSQTLPGNLSLQVLATQSGGLVLNSLNDVSQLLEQCFHDGDHLYELTFNAPAAKHPDEYHHLELKLNRPGGVVRTRDGYYAQPARHP
jgi:VWFA-related protein